MMSKIISFEDIYCNKVMENILEMVYDLESDGVKIDVTSYQLNGILHQLYRLYESKQTLYSYVDTMNSYFATVFTDISESDMRTVTFSNILDGIFNCSEMMSPVEIERCDVNRVLKKIRKFDSKRGGNNYAR